jgi:hypothetical protein
VNRVAALQQHVVQFNDATYRSAAHTANPLRGLKSALSVLEICSTHVTPPLRHYSSAEQERVQKYLRGLNVLSAPQLSLAGG